MTGMRTEVVRTLGIAFGSGLGAICRWGLGWDGGGSAWEASISLLAINAFGSLAIGTLSVLDRSHQDGHGLGRDGLVRDIAMTGFCGGFTAFSLFNADLLRMAEGAGVAAALALALVSVALWLGGLLAGRAAGQRLTRTRG